MKEHMSSAIVSLVFFWSLCLLASQEIVGAQTHSETVRIGTFDSRAVALAFWRSDEGMGVLDGVSVELQKAREAGDEARVRELEAKGPAIQIRMNQQVFSTGTVTDILKRVQVQIPVVAENSGVSPVVSKWQITYQDPSVEMIDITMELVSLFSSTEDILARVKRVMETEPIPIDELPMDPRG
jgi:hypothetical protein